MFAIVVGFITNAIESGMEALSSGKTKVAEADHTLILGWNEATMRVVVQISFLRRQYQVRPWAFPKSRHITVCQHQD